MDRLLLPLLMPIDVWYFWAYTQTLHKDVHPIALPWMYLGFLLGPAYLIHAHYTLHQRKPTPRLALGFSCLANSAMSLLIWRTCTPASDASRIWYSPQIYLLVDICRVLLVSLLFWALLQVLAVPPVGRRHNAPDTP